MAEGEDEDNKEEDKYFDESDIPSTDNCKVK
jgi:hypothetical protein